MRDVLDNTGITATAGIGTNMYLAKIAMDVYAKRMRADKNGARIGELNEIIIKAPDKLVCLSRISTYLAAKLDAKTTAAARII